MNDAPRTSYVKTVEGLHIAYQVIGNGPIDLAILPQTYSNMETYWEDPVATRFFRRLSSFCRLVLFDKRGTGLSDPVPLRAIPTVEEWMDDLMTVLDAVGSKSAYLLGTDAGGAPALVAAATHPGRVAGLVLLNAFARLSRAPDYPIGLPPHVQEYVLDSYERDFASPSGIAFDSMMPSRTGDPAARDWWARMGRHSVGLGTAEQMLQAIFRLDVREVLGAVHQPTLVLHRQGDDYVRAGHGRYLADHLPRTSFVELPGADHLFNAGDIDDVLDEIEEFLTGARHAPNLDRMLSTVMFTDIVGSTEQAARAGDRRWKELLDDHDEVVGRVVERYRGRKIKTTGDGVLALFDGPARAIWAATTIRDRVSERLALATRCGVHTGEVELRGEDVGGIAVHIGQRVSALANPSEVLASRTVTDLVVGSGIEFDDRGEHELKGIPGRWQLYAVR